MTRTRSLAAALGASLALSLAATPALSIESAEIPQDQAQAEDGGFFDGSGDGFGEGFNRGFDVVVLRPLATMKVGLGLFVAMPIASLFDFLALPASQEPKYFVESWDRYVREPAWYAFERPIGEDLVGR